MHGNTESDLYGLDASSPGNETDASKQDYSNEDHKNSNRELVAVQGDKTVLNRIDLSFQ